MKQKILLIEDDLNIIKNLELLLSNSGYDILKAVNGEEGISLAKKEIPDLIICDIMLPTISGYDIIEEIHAEEKLAATPFIYLTAKVEAKDLRKGMDLGADDYLLKPYKADELLNAVALRLKKSKKIRASVESEIKSEDKVFEYDSSIFIDDSKTPLFVKVNEIKLINAEKQYTNIVLESGKNLIARKSLNHWEKILPPKYFMRVHRSHLVNLTFVSSIKKWDNNLYKLQIKEYGELVSVSRGYLKKLKEFFNN